MIVVYLYGKNVFAQVSIQYILSSFSDLDEAVRLISEKTGLSFERTIDQIGYKVYECTNELKDVKIIAESTKILES